MNAIIPLVWQELLSKSQKTKLEIEWSASFPRYLNPSIRKKKYQTIYDLGWTHEKAVRIRAQLASFASDWDDPEMDVYDDEY
ncbi:MAG: hypothetical protein P9M15_04740 [Candidatus Electryoneaceae bacterium]|nr:hypothetical protein [Candidatus Electryoneaceae bacterium]